MDVNNWGKDRNLSESESRWTWRSTSIRQNAGSGPTDRQTQRQFHHGQHDCRGPCQRAKGGVSLSGSIQYFCLALKHQGFTDFFFLDHLMFLFSRNITLVVKEHTFSLECKENFGDLSSNREVSIKFSFPYYDTLNPKNEHTFIIWNNLAFHSIINS